MEARVPTYNKCLSLLRAYSCGIFLNISRPSWYKAWRNDFSWKKEKKASALLWRLLFDVEKSLQQREREREEPGKKSENKYWKKPLFRIDIQHQACTVISVCWGYSEAAINPDKSEFKRGKETESYGWWIIRVMGARKTFLAYIAFMQPVSLVSTRPPRTVPTVLSQRRGNMVDINGKQNIF